MKIGYARVSTQDQNLQLQIDALQKEGCEKIFQEKIGAIKERAELEKMLITLREGDSVIIWKLDRLGRSLKQLITLVDEFGKKNINLKSINDNIDTSSPNGKLFFNIMASLSQYEREMIVERTRAGLESAKKRGRIGGRPNGLSKVALQKAATARHLYSDKKLPISEITSTLNIGKATLYRYLRYMNVEIGA
jgi:DNA invertase Pin-like site-specific DNA recombinase